MKWSSSSANDPSRLHRGPELVRGITLYQIFGYNLLIISAVIGLRLLYTIFRVQRGR